MLLSRYKGKKNFSILKTKEHLFVKKVSFVLFFVLINLNDDEVINVFFPYIILKRTRKLWVSSSQLVPNSTKRPICAVERTCLPMQGHTS